MAGLKEIGKNDRKLIANTIRIISAEMVEEANSGDPGFPMACADLAYVLWHHFLKFYPENPNWPNRDRFILSPGYGSALLYTLLHLYGFEVNKEDLKNYREMDSKTPATPQLGITPGIELTTGPPGQGLAMGVGMALTAKMRAARFNKDSYKIFGQHNIFGLLDNGDIMEGVTSEAASIAGHYNLDNIVYIYAKEKTVRNNEAKTCFSENVKEKFKGHGWRAMRINGHSHRAIHTALKKGIAQDRPTIIIARVHAGYGSPSRQDDPQIHNNPLGRFELRETKRRMGFSPSSSFYIPREVKQMCRDRINNLEEQYFNWLNEYNEWKNEYPELSTEWDEKKKEKIPDDLENVLLENIDKGQMSTRQMSKSVFRKLMELYPNLVGGIPALVQDLGLDIESISLMKKRSFQGNMINFGLRDHAMAAILNGMAVNSDFIVFGGNYLSSSDYMKPALRMASRMNLPLKYLFTRDSCRVGQEGPSLHPVEQLTMLRSIPQMSVIRPADRMETAAAWSIAMQKNDGPVSVILTSQSVPKLRGIEPRKMEDVMKGGYIASESRDKYPEVTVVASGSELKPCLEAKKTLLSYGITVRVVSMPCREIFMQQPRAYRNSVIPIKNSIVAVVEASNSMGWEELTWLPLRVIGIDQFVKSGPEEEVTEEAGMDADSIAHEVDRFVGWIEEWEEDKDRLEDENS